MRKNYPFTESSSNLFRKFLTLSSILARSLLLSSNGGRLEISSRKRLASSPYRIGVFLIGFAIKIQIFYLTTKLSIKSILSKLFFVFNIEADKAMECRQAYLADVPALTQ